MKRIWAPWRLEAILDAIKKTSRSKKKSACIFCDIQKGKASADNLVLYKTKLAYVVMNKYPYTSAHLMVIPTRHIGKFGLLTKDEHRELGTLLALAQEVLDKMYKPHGYNIGMNLGAEAGAGIREHIHYHLVPRWTGDHNFMPVISEVRVMLEKLGKTYAQLKKEFDRCT